MKGIKEIFMKNKERRKGWIASALAMVLLMGSIPFTSAFGVEETSDNETKTILTYAESESGTVLGEYIPNEDAEKAWQSGFSDFQSNMERDGYTNISEAFEENEMVYVGGEDSVVPAGYVRDSEKETVPLNPYDGSGGGYFLWRYCKANKSMENIENAEIVDVESSGVVENDDTKFDGTITEYFWVRTNQKVELEKWNLETDSGDRQVTTGDSSMNDESEIENINEDEFAEQQVENKKEVIENKESKGIKVEPGIANGSVLGDESWHENWKSVATALKEVKAPDRVFRLTFYSDGDVDLDNKDYGLDKITLENCAGIIITGVEETETEKNSESNDRFSLSSDGFGNNTNLIEDNADPSKNKYKGEAPEGAPTVRFVAAGNHTALKIPFTIRNVKLNLQWQLYGNGNRIQYGPGLSRVDNNRWSTYGGTYSDVATYENTSLTIYGGKWYWVGSSGWNQTTIGTERLRIYGGDYSLIHGHSEYNTAGDVDINIDIREGYGDFVAGNLEALRGHEADADSAKVQIHADKGVAGRIVYFENSTRRITTNEDPVAPNGYDVVIDAPDFSIDRLLVTREYGVDGRYTMPSRITINNIKSIGQLQGIHQNNAGLESKKNYFPYDPNDDEYGDVIEINCDLEIPYIIGFTKLKIGNGAEVTLTNDNSIYANVHSVAQNVEGVSKTTDVSGDVDIVEGATLNLNRYQANYGVRNIGSSDGTGTLRVNPTAHFGVYVKGDYYGGLTLDVVDSAITSLRNGLYITKFLNSSNADRDNLFDGENPKLKLGENLRKFGVATEGSGTGFGYLKLTDKKDYYITYKAENAQGGVPRTELYEAGSSVTVATGENMIPPEGKVFDYWESNIEVKVDNQATTIFYGGEKFVMPENDITLTAKWKEADGDISFEGSENGEELVLKLLNMDGNSTTKELPNILVNGKPITAEQTKNLTYTYESYVRTRVDGKYVYDWSGQVFDDSDGNDTTEINKLPITLAKPENGGVGIKVTSRFGRSGIVRLKISYGKDGKSASCILIVPGDIDLNGYVRYDDTDLIYDYVNDVTTLEDYPYQTLMADMNSDSVTGRIRITGVDGEVLENILSN